MLPRDINPAMQYLLDFMLDAIDIDTVIISYLIVVAVPTLSRIENTVIDITCMAVNSIAHQKNKHSGQTRESAGLGLVVTDP